MFTIELQRGWAIESTLGGKDNTLNGINFAQRFSKDATLTAKASTLYGAIGFVQRFTYDGLEADGMVITGVWVELDGGYVMEVFDWNDCWTTNPPPLARIKAPPGFVPL